VIPLLVPASKTEFTDWICSIARKHATETGTDTAAQESDIAWASYLDEETQWEVFLRHAGFNPFAAQTVLVIAKMASQSSGMSVQGLSLFVEVDSAKRRTLFASVVGQRVLARVERVVEQDWQLDWALDLNGDE
jgi:hypothetical protein